MTKAKETENKERIILLLAGDSGSGKSWFVANLKRALIIDTDIGGGVSYAQARIERNGSERIEMGSYPEVIDELTRRKKHLSQFNTVAIDHLSTLHEEAVIRHNPRLVKDFGAAADKAAREWRRLREIIRYGDFNLVCTSHLKGKWADEKVVGMQADAAKKIEADFHIVLHVTNPGTPIYPLTASVHKWRRDPEDQRGPAPMSLPFTVEDFLKAEGVDMLAPRHEIPMATEEQIAELGRLLEIVKLPEGTVEKWLSKAKAETFADMSREIIAKCISHVTELVNKPK